MRATVRRTVMSTVMSTLRHTAMATLRGTASGTSGAVFYRLAAALALFLVCAAVQPAAAQEQPGQTEQLQARTFEIASQLRCPVCVSESVAQSSSPTSIEMRQIVQEQLEQGRSEAQILAFFQDRYGDWILLEPPKRGLHLLVWLLPAVAALVGLGMLAYYLRRWTRAGNEPVEASDADLRRVRDALSDQK